jgi:hypothetical protein
MFGVKFLSLDVALTFTSLHTFPAWQQKKVLPGSKKVMMKFSRAIIRVKWFSSEKTNVSKTISLLVLRVLVWLWLGKTFCPIYT